MGSGGHHAAFFVGEQASVLDSLAVSLSPLMLPPTSSDPTSLQQDAWLGDAVLELYVRQWILRQEGRLDAEMKTRFTCNQFLNCIGNPTRVEAHIGSLYREGGLPAAWEWIALELEPLFLKQEAKRARHGL
jgi:hypothetical protein